MATNTTSMKTEALAVRTPEQKGELDKPREGMTTPQKVGVAAGVTGATGLAVFGLYKLGARYGWWSRRTDTIVIDDSSDKRSGDGGTKDRSSGGGSSTRKRAIGKPPNTSGDPEGYNTKLFQGPGPVRLAMIAIGYKVKATPTTLVPDDKPNGEVQRFQNDWNRVIRGLDSGRVKFPPADDKRKLKQFRGLLIVDGIPGKNTLNALEIAFSNMTKNKMKWTSLVRQAR